MAGMNISKFKQFNWGWVVANTLPLFVVSFANQILSVGSLWKWYFTTSILIGMSLAIGQTLYFIWNKWDIRFVVYWISTTVIGFSLGNFIALWVTVVVGGVLGILGVILEVSGLTELMDFWVNPSVLTFIFGFGILFPLPVFTGFITGIYIGALQGVRFEKFGIQFEWRKWNLLNGKAGGLAGLLCFVSLLFTLPMLRNLLVLLPFILGLPIAFFTQSAAREIRDQLILETLSDQSDQ